MDTGHICSNDLEARDILKTMAQDILRTCFGDVVCPQMCTQSFERIGPKIECLSSHHTIWLLQTSIKIHMKDLPGGIWDHVGNILFSQGYIMVIQHYCFMCHFSPWGNCALHELPSSTLRVLPQRINFCREKPFVYSAGLASINNLTPCFLLSAYTSRLARFWVSAIALWDSRELYEIWLVHTRVFLDDDVEFKVVMVCGLLWFYLEMVSKDFCCFQGERNAVLEISNGIMVLLMSMHV